MVRAISMPLGASGSALLRTRRPGTAATRSISAAVFPAAVGVVGALAPVRQKDGRSPVQHPFDEHPFTGAGRTLAVDLRRTDHRDGETAVEHLLLGRHLVGAVALTGIGIRVAGTHRGLVFPDVTGEVRAAVGVDVPPVPVNVNGFAGEHDRRGHAVEERDELARIGGGEAGSSSRNGKINTLRDQGWSL